MAEPGRPGETRALPVPDGLAGERVDAALARMLGLSRTRAAELAAEGKVLVDGSAATKSDRLAAGAWLEVELPSPESPVQVVAEPVPGMRIVHDDADLVVVDKPVGVAAHPSPGWTGLTVIGGLAAAGYTIATSGAAERQGVVHRLDVGTSGLMVVAKSEQAYNVLKQAFRDRTVDKTYHAVVQGMPDPSRGTVDAPIGRHPTLDYKWAVTADGKASVTHYETLEVFRAASLLEIHLETGRTHQIRVHMAALRHPCVGDLTYGADPTLATRLGLTRQWLHAVGLAFDHPGTGDRVSSAATTPTTCGPRWTACARSHRAGSGVDLRAVEVLSPKRLVRSSSVPLSSSVMPGAPHAAVDPLAKLDRVLLELWHAHVGGDRELSLHVVRDADELQPEGSALLAVEDASSTT